MDKNNNLQKHNYHMVLNNELKNKIIKLADRLNLNISDTAVYILNETICILNKFHFDVDEIDEISTYQNIDWDEDLHIHIDKTIFRKIKYLSNTMHAFSIAIVVRKLFNYFFKILELSNGNIERVRKIFKRFYQLYVKNYGGSLKVWKKNIKSKQLFGKFYHYLEFNDKFTVTGFNYIKSD